MFRFGRAKVQLKIRRDYCGNVPGAVLGLKAEPNGDWKHGFRRMASFGKFVSTDEDLFVSRLKHHGDTLVLVFSRLQSSWDHTKRAGGRPCFQVLILIFVSDSKEIGAALCVLFAGCVC
jgi:hypothetical protein